jgi:hypothetical protein
MCMYVCIYVSPPPRHTCLAKGNVREFGQNKELYPQSGGSGSVGGLRIGAEIFPERERREVVYKLGKGPEHADEGKEGQKEIPGREGGPRPEWFACAKVGLSRHHQESVE